MYFYSILVIQIIKNLDLELRDKNFFLLYDNLYDNYVNIYINKIN